MPKISVIIPIYRAETYIERCVRSVMIQSLREIEIICVDDASPDKSATIVERLAAEDSRIRLIRHDRNRGAGPARNTGIEAARSPYVTGVDSDDYILPETMEKLWEETGGGVANVVVYGIRFVDNDGTPTGQSISPRPGRYENTDNQFDIFDQLNPSFCNKIWLTSLFTQTGIRFPEHTAYFEDLATMPRVLSHARDIRVIPGDFYQYVIREGSKTHSATPQHIIDYFKTYDIFDDFLRQEELQVRYQADFVRKIGKSLFYHASGVANSNMVEEQKAQYLRHMLMLKLGYLENLDLLRDLDAEMLQKMIDGAISGQDIDYPVPKPTTG